MSNNLISLLYVSTSTIAPSQAEARVQDIVATSMKANPLAFITGALIFTETRFAQILEGPESAVDTLMERIKRDTRHRDIMVLARGPISRRAFGQWGLAYAGPSLLIARTVSKPFYDAMRGVKPDAEELRSLMTSFRFADA